VSGCPAVAPVGGVPRPLVLSFPGRGSGSGWSAGGEGLQAGDRDGDLAGPGPSFGEAEPQAAAAGGEPAGGGEDSQAQAFRFPAAGGPGQGKELGLGQQFAPEPPGTNGFGYDSIFIPDIDPGRRTYAQMTSDEKTRPPTAGSPSMPCEVASDWLEPPDRTADHYDQPGSKRRIRTAWRMAT